ncbi:MAG: prephenate dehydrogenase [Sphingobacteriales bacterium SCN 48-20]|uniref:prephenate dehydrogenase n=1 Tax=Terrimonas ferruginea TaxID=249 RepID=UPI00086956FA|nr:prephenate dehydrogenase [Terrimonas ferruginea]MBN8784263.1 prephenate dehydrogenase [Terrimonas ferruginea]ODT92965.1 MAG: prephenate dehydrogenase [Sphingobacteriales bacterium SCN 48-20]OJW39143.1 MAG: prephenate dehydrogenase [Sphingobacteriales bacterium 48-107]
MLNERINIERKKVAIVGTGLIGGSLALRLHERKISSRLIGVDASAEHLRQALEMELVDEVMPLTDAIAAAEVIVLAIPVDRLVGLLPSILDQVDQQIVLDLGSTKSQLTDIIKDHPKRGRYVATHPMWGTEYSGPRAAVRGAYEDKAVIICNAWESDGDALEWVRSMYKKIGMHLLEMEARAHDLHAAYVSHISHITSFALANTVLQKEKEQNAIFEMASAGFESTVRLAKSSPAMWVPIFLQNKENVLDVLTEHIAQLTRFKQSIENGDGKALEDLIGEANKIKRIIK